MFLAKIHFLHLLVLAAWPKMTRIQDLLELEDETQHPVSSKRREVKTHFPSHLLRARANRAARPCLASWPQGKVSYWKRCEGYGAASHSASEIQLQMEAAICIWGMWRDFSNFLNKGLRPALPWNQVAKALKLRLAHQHALARKSISSLITAVLV